MSTSSLSKALCNGCNSRQCAFISIGLQCQTHVSCLFSHEEFYNVSIWGAAMYESGSLYQVGIILIREILRVGLVPSLSGTQ